MHIILAAFIVFALSFAEKIPANAQGFETNHQQSRSTRILSKFKPTRTFIRSSTQTPPVTIQEPPPKEPPAVTFGRWAVIGLAISGFVLFVSFRLFTPNGLLNNLAKADYMPSQFKSQHRKFLLELAKAARQQGLPLGVRADGIMSKIKATQVAVPRSHREENPHILVAGAGGKGKSRLLANWIRHDIYRGDRAIVVIDSEGGLADLILSEILSRKNGEALAQRVVILDPVRKSGTKRSYDPLRISEDQDPQILANNVVLGFKAIYQEVPNRQGQDQWNAQTANILRNAVMLLMANGRTLADLPALLSENDFRDILLQNLERIAQPNSTFSTVLEAWAQYRRLARTDQWISWVEPILNRVQPVLSDIRIKQALTSSQDSIDLAEIISEKKVLLVRLPQGQLDPSANLLGSLVITGLRQAAVNLAVTEFGHATPCALYVDELDEFVDSETFGFITTESRRYKIGITGAVRTLQSMPEMYRNQILANVGMLCTFALARKDAEQLGPQMFRVDGRKYKHRPIQAFFNPLSATPQFELITDEEKLNIDRLIGLERQEYFCYRVGSTAGVLKVRAPQLADSKPESVDKQLVEKVYRRKKENHNEDAEEFAPDKRRELSRDSNEVCRSRSNVQEVHQGRKVRVHG